MQIVRINEKINIIIDTIENEVFFRVEQEDNKNIKKISFLIGEKGLNTIIKSLVKNKLKLELDKYV